MMHAMLVTVGSGMLFAQAGPDMIHLRGQAEPRIGHVEQSNRSGLRLLMDGGVEVIPWTDVADVEIAGGQPSNVEDLLVLGRDLHRARGRIERGDFRGAEPLLARHFRTGPGAVTDTDLLCADGLMRCRLDRGALPEAVVPLLEVTRALRAGATSPWTPIVDAQRAVCPWLGPAWLGTDARRRLAVVLRQWDSGNDPVLEQARLAYLSLAEDSEINRAAPGLIAQIARSIHGDDPARRGAVANLESGLEASEPWERAWRHWAIGRAMLQEPGDGRSRAALAHLARIPALHGDQQPWLAGMATALMAMQADRDGRPEVAESLRAELVARWPGHPVLDPDTHLSVPRSAQADREKEIP